MQHLSNLKTVEEICTTNPCGEVPLPRHGACDLGSFNLTRFVRDPFTAAARIDLDALLDEVPSAVRLLDNVYELSGFPTHEQRNAALATRRIGLGFTGLADALIMLGLRYDEEHARRLAAHLMRSVAEQAYRSSIELAREKGPFPQFSAHEFLSGEFAQRLPTGIRSGIAKHGLRNSWRPREPSAYLPAGFPAASNPRTPGNTLGTSALAPPAANRCASPIGHGLCIGGCSAPVHHCPTHSKRQRRSTPMPNWPCRLRCSSTPTTRFPKP
jgi:ribonucleotide reductase alpha subunit